MEARLLESVFPTDTNPQGNLFGGTLVSWMDKAAGFAAMRRARSSVVTAAIEDIAFQVPILQGDLVGILATVISVGRTSMRVRVEVRKERPIEGTTELARSATSRWSRWDRTGSPSPCRRHPRARSPR